MPYKNTEEDRLYAKKYRNENKDKIAAQQKIYQKKYRQDPKYHKSQTMKRWISKGLQESPERILEIYDIYMNSNICDCCNIEIISGRMGGNHKVMDHDHITGKFRNILCHNCNIMRFHKENNYEAYLRMLTL